jgi:hypothetical protein
MEHLRAQGIPFIASWGLSRAPRRGPTSTLGSRPRGSPPADESKRNPGYGEVKIEHGITQADIGQSFRTLIKT